MQEQITEKNRTASPGNHSSLQQSDKQNIQVFLSDLYILYFALILLLLYHNVVLMILKTLQYRENMSEIQIFGLLLSSEKG